MPYGYFTRNRNSRKSVERHVKCLKTDENESCFLCDAINDIHRLSVECKVNAFIETGIFIPELVRSCNHHLGARRYILPALLAGIRSINKACLIRGDYLQVFLLCMREVSINQRRIQDANDLSEEEMLVLTSLTHAQFANLATYCDPVFVQGGNRYISHKDLLVFLCKMRQGLSDECLTVIFNNTTRQATSLAVAKVRESLMRRFVTENIGLNAITRQQFIDQHVTEYANILYNPNPANPVAVVYIDGTYVDCHKTKNFRALRQSFCRHKGRHLVKPALIVASDGYILDIHGPYFSDNHNNDAAMIRNEFENDETINKWFQPGDVVIVDRGYRDVIPMFREFGLVTKMPPLLQHREHQLSTENANEARKISRTRWFVESRNGHLKSKFNYLNLTQQIHVLPNIGDFYKICGAIINR